MSTASERRRAFSAFVAALSLSLATACARYEPRACTGDETAPIVDSATVCAHLADLGCHFEHAVGTTEGEACAAAYDATHAKVDDVAFARITTCYVAARSCGAVGACSLACSSPGVDAGVDAGTDADFDAGP